MMILLTGCTVREDVTIYSNGKVYEKITIPVSTNGMSEKEFVYFAKNRIYSYNDVLKVRKYQSNVYYGKKTSSVSLTNNYDNICEYVEKTLASKYIYEHKNETPHIDYCFDCVSTPALEDVTYTITLPFEAAESTADSINKNVYTWKFNKDTQSNKQFYLKINKEDFNKAVTKEEKTKKFVGVGKIVLYIIVGIALLFLGYTEYKKLKEKYIERNKIGF